MADLSLSISADSITAMLTTAVQLSTSEIESIAKSQMSRILDRTSQAIGVGGAFSPLSKQYAKRKMRKGGKGIADLRSAGTGPHMLDTMHIEAGHTSSDETTCAIVVEGKSAGFSQATHPFMGATTDETQQMTEQAQTLISQRGDSSVGSWVPATMAF